MTTAAPVSPARDDALYDRAVVGLNDAQLQAVTHRDGPLLVVAGPGSGKTRVLTHRIAALVADGVPPWAILAVTFTNKAAEEMRHRVTDLLVDTVDAKVVSRMWVCTFHSACVRILRRDAGVIGRPTDFSIVDQTDARRLLTQILPDELRDQARDLHEQISLAKNRLETPQTLTGGFWHPRLAEVWLRYRDELINQSMFDFDDLLIGALDVLTRDAAVADVYRRRFTHILVDEFQDTNDAQYQILHRLGAHGNVCVVGDADQSIFGWRGSSPAVLDQFLADWPATEKVTLGENYRSTPEILAVAQEVIDQEPSVTRARLHTSNSSGAKPGLFVLEDEQAEAAFVAGRIATSSDAPSAHAVIYRTKAQSRLLESALTALGVPYRLVGDVAFYQRSEIRDTLAWLKTATNPADRGSLRRAASVPRRRIGDGAIEALWTLADDLDATPAEAFAVAGDELAPAPRRAWQSCFDDLASVHDALADGPHAAVQAVFAIPGFVEAATGRDGDTAANRKENLDALATAAVQFETGSSVNYPSEVLATLSGTEQTFAFLSETALLAGAVDDSDVDACVLLTAHSAKGREFDHVHVVGCENGYFPHRSASNDADVAEERRLLFVAITRARRHLTLTWAQYRFAFGTTNYQDLSPFLEPVQSVVRDMVRSARRPSTGGRAGMGAQRRAPRTQAVRDSRTVRPAIPVPDGPRLTAGELRVGAQVQHATFGAGVVEAFDADVAHITFATGRRAMMLSHAPLTLVTPTQT